MPKERPSPPPTSAPPAPSCCRDRAPPWWRSAETSGSPPPSSSRRRPSGRASPRRSGTSRRRPPSPGKEKGLPRRPAREAFRTSIPPLREQLRHGLRLDQLARLLQVVQHDRLRVDAEGVVDGRQEL